MSNGHVHAELMAEYAEDAKTTVEPWLLWELLQANGWVGFTCQTPLWDAHREYRRKPRTININGREVPEPFRGELRSNQTYYIPDFTESSLYYEFCNFTHITSGAQVARGIVHLTKDAAIAHGKALLSFTEVSSDE